MCLTCLSDLALTVIMSAQLLTEPKESCRCMFNNTHTALYEELINYWYSSCIHEKAILYWINDIMLAVGLSSQECLSANFNFNCSFHSEGLLWKSGIFVCLDHVGYHCSYNRWGQKKCYANHRALWLYNCQSVVSLHSKTFVLLCNRVAPYLNRKEKKQIYISIHLQML